MERCYKCGVSSDMAVLYDAISEKEIVKICERCRMKESIPIIKKTRLPEEPEKRLTVRERLSYLSGFKPNEKSLGKEVSEEAKRQNEELKKIIAKRYEDELSTSKIKVDTSGDSGMVRNFHWAIMRARRAKHLTQRGLADKINEPEIAIKLAEKGILPREKEFLIKKIQNALNIQITKIPYDTYTQLPEKRHSEDEMNESELLEDGELKLDSEKEKSWTIGDLLRFRKRKPKEETVDISKVFDEDSNA